jgi:hypothetical protein
VPTVGKCLTRKEYGMKNEIGYYFDARGRTEYDFQNALKEIEFKDRNSHPIALVTKKQFDGIQEFYRKFGADKVNTHYMGFKLIVCEGGKT